MAKLTEKQRCRWGAMNELLYSHRPLSLKEIFESDEENEPDDADGMEQLGFDCDMEIEDDDA